MQRCLAASDRWEREGAGGFRTALVNGLALVGKRRAPCLAAVAEATGKLSKDKQHAFLALISRSSLRLLCSFP